MYGYIYKTTVNNGESSLNCHYYIGQKQSEMILNRYYGSGKKITSYIKKNGTRGLKREIIAVAESREELNRLEFDLIGSLWETDKICMNMRAGGYREGFKMSTESVEKLRKSMIGKNIGNTYNHSEEAKKKIRVAGIGRKATEKQREALSKGADAAKVVNIGRVVTEETRKKLREKIVSEETREKLRLAAIRQHKRKDNYGS